MSRIRAIKPEFAESESISRLSRDARLLFILLWTIVDDFGKTRASPKLIKGKLFHADDDADVLVDDWLTELDDGKFIDRYVVDGTHYLRINKWEIHQRIDKPTPSKLPDNPGVQPVDNQENVDDFARTSEDILLEVGRGIGKGRRKKEGYSLRSYLSSDDDGGENATNGFEEAQPERPVWFSELDEPAQPKPSADVLPMVGPAPLGKPATCPDSAGPAEGTTQSVLRLVEDEPAESPPDEPIRLKRKRAEPDDAEEIQEFCHRWNDLASSIGLAQVEDITKSRVGQIRARSRELVTTWGFPDTLAGVDAMLAKVKNSPLLAGQTGTWRASFDWVIALKNFTKIMENTYETKRKIGTF